MNEQREMHIIENTIETTLSGLTPDPFLAQRVAQGIRVKGSNMKTKKKIPLSAVLVNAAVLAAVALLLFGLGPARQNMQKNDPPSGVLQPLTTLPSPSAQPLTAEEEKVLAAARQCIQENYGTPEDEMNALEGKADLLPAEGADVPQRWQVILTSSPEWFSKNSDGHPGPYGTYVLTLDAQTYTVRSHQWFTLNFWENAQRVWDAGNYDEVYLQYQSLSFFYQSLEQQAHFTKLLQEKGYAVRKEEDHFDTVLQYGWMFVHANALEDNHPQSLAAWQALEEKYGFSPELMRSHCYMAGGHGGQTETDDVIIAYSETLCQQMIANGEMDNNTAFLLRESQRTGCFMVSFEKGTTHIRNITRFHPNGTGNQNPNAPLLAKGVWNAEDYLSFVQAYNQLEKAMRRMDAALMEPSYKEQVAENFLLQLGGDPNRYQPCDPQRMPQQWFTENSIYDYSVETNHYSLQQVHKQYGEDSRFWPMEVQSAMNSEYSMPREGEITQAEAIQLALQALVEQKGQAALDALGEYKVGCRLYRVQNNNSWCRWHVFITEKENAEEGYKVVFALMDGVLPDEPIEFTVDHIQETGNG